MTAEGSTRPTAWISMGTVPTVTDAMLTGTAGGGAADCAFSVLQAVLTATQRATEETARDGYRSTTDQSYYSFRVEPSCAAASRVVAGGRGAPTRLPPRVHRHG